MVRATWNGAVLAESDHTIKIEGNLYFPPESLRREYFTSSESTTSCPWKGQARYYDLTVDGKTSQDAAWFYPRPRPAASKIAGHVAFWRGVRIDCDGHPGAEQPGAMRRARPGRILRWFHQRAAQS